MSTVSGDTKAIKIQYIVTVIVAALTKLRVTMFKKGGSQLRPLMFLNKRHQYE